MVKCCGPAPLSTALVKTYPTPCPWCRGDGDTFFALDFFHVSPHRAFPMAVLGAYVATYRKKMVSGRGFLKEVMHRLENCERLGMLDGCWMQASQLLCCFLNCYLFDGQNYRLYYGHLVSFHHCQRNCFCGTFVALLYTVRQWNFCSPGQWFHHFYPAAETPHALKLIGKFSSFKSVRISGVLMLFGAALEAARNFQNTECYPARLVEAVWPCLPVLLASPSWVCSPYLQH